MTNDLLFSVLPRQGTVPIAHDEQKVQRVSKEAALRELNDKEQTLHLEERESRKQQQHAQSDKNDNPDAKSKEESDDSGNVQSENGFKHLDIYV